MSETEKVVLPAAPLTFGSPSLVDAVVGTAPAVTITRELAISVLRDLNGQIPPLALSKLGLLFASPLAYLSDEQRRRMRQQVLAEMLENKRALIERLRQRLDASTNEDERERLAEELYTWLEEDIRERMAESQPGGEPASGVKVSVCDAACVALLARVIYAEAAGENDGVMAAMGWVVMNRVRDQTHEFRDLDTCEEVIMQPGAFSSVGGTLWVQVDNLAAMDPPSRAAYERARAIAARICSGELVDPTRGALVYYSPKRMNPPFSRPAWRFHLLEEVVIDGVTNGALKLFRYR